MKVSVYVFDCFKVLPKMQKICMVKTLIGLYFVWLSCKQDNTILCGTYIVHIKYPAQPLGYGILSSIVSSDDPWTHGSLTWYQKGKEKVFSSEEEDLGERLIFAERSSQWVQNFYKFAIQFNEIMNACDHPCWQIFTIFEPCPPPSAFFATMYLSANFTNFWPLPWRKYVNSEKYKYFRYYLKKTLTPLLCSLVAATYDL